MADELDPDGTDDGGTDDAGLRAMVTDLVRDAVAPIAAQLDKLGKGQPPTPQAAPSAGPADTGHDPLDLQALVERVVADVSDKRNSGDRLAAAETKVGELAAQLEAMSAPPRRGWGSWLVGV